MNLNPEAREPISEACRKDRATQRGTVIIPNQTAKSMWMEVIWLLGGAYRFPLIWESRGVFGIVTGPY